MFLLFLKWCLIDLKVKFEQSKLQIKKTKQADEQINMNPTMNKLALREQSSIVITTCNIEPI